MYDNETLLNSIAMISFLVGIANYNENLTQSDKDDIMHTLDNKTNDILHEVQKSLDEQNEMLKEILERIKRLENE